MIRFNKIVSCRPRAQSHKDRRHIVTRYVVEYQDESGWLYRKSFETKEDKKPSIPMSGTHNSINSKKYQW